MKKSLTLPPRGLLVAGGLVAALMVTGFTASASTVAHYRFEDGAAGNAATSAVDISGNGYDLPAHNSPLFSSEVPVDTVPQTGASNALSIDFGSGENAFVGTADAGLSLVEFTDFTIEAWVYFHNPGGWQTIIGRDDSGDPGQGVGGASLLYFSSSGAGGMNNGFRIEVITSSNTNVQVNSNQPVLANTWYHIAAVGNASAGTLSLYVDGILLGSASGFDGLLIPSFPATPWTFGRGQWAGDPGDWMNGRIDEVRFSSAALSPAEFLNFEEERIEIVQQPQSVVAWAGQDVTFETQAIFVGAGELQYQWEISTDGENWSPISGANQSSYTLPAASVTDDGTYYRAAISGTELTVHTAAAFLRVGDATPPEPQGVVAHYRFEGGTDGAMASVATDSSGNGHHLNVIGSPTYSSDIPIDPLPQTRESNTLSMDFRGGSYGFEGADNDPLSQVVFNDFTLEAWVKHETVGGAQTYIGRDDAGGTGQGVWTEAGHALLYFQNHWDGNDFRVQLVTNEGQLITVVTGYVPATNVWYHVAAVGDSGAGTLSFYVNGNLVGQTTGFTGLANPVSPATKWTVGRGQWDGNPVDYLDGQLDEVRISSVALSPVEFLNFNNAVLRFHTEPADYTAAVGETVLFTSLAGGGGTGELTYQWEVSTDGGENWSPISGATAPTLSVESVTVSYHLNQYRVIASRDGVNVASGAAVLSVPDYPPPVIVQGLAQGHLAFEGEDFTYSVQATGIGNIMYQWQKDGVDLEGETGTALSLTSLTRADEGTYSVVVTDDAALADELEPASVTLSSYLAVAPHLRGAVSLNFVGSGSANWGSTAELAPIHPHEVAGAVPVANWNNSATESWVSVQETPIPLVSDTGAATPMAATWDAENTWSARAPSGPPTTKQPNERLFHGFIERRAEDASENPATITITGIPYDTYDVYVYPMSVEGAQGTVIRNVRMEDANGVRELFMRAYTGDPTPEQMPVILSHAATLQEAIDGQPATVLRFGGASGSTVTLRHYDNNEHGFGWNAGGFAAISIVDTTESAPARPKLVSRPAGRVVPAGATATLSVTAEPVNPGGSLSYQWQRNGANIGGATGSTYSIPDASSAHGGYYTVVVTDTSSVGTSVNTASAQLVVVDDARRVLISGDMHFTAPDVEHLEMSGHGILRTDGPVTIDPATGDSNPHGIGEGDTIWNRLALGTQGRTYLNLFDAEGLHLSGVTFTVTGATGNEDAPTGGGIDDPVTDFSGPLLRDYVYTEGENVMTATLGGLHAFAGREVTLVVYAIGKSSATWPSDPSRNDVATVTLAAQNSPDGEPVSGVTDQVEGRDLRYNNEAHVTFDAVVAANGTVTWTVGPVPGEEGLNAFNGFQLLLTDHGEPLDPPAVIWRLAYFGTAEATGDAAWTADPDFDGIVNLLEYALGSDPTIAGDALGSVFVAEVDGFLTLTFAHIDDPALTYEIEAADSLNGGWSVVHSYPAFTEWGVETYSEAIVPGAPRRFLRLKITIVE